MIIKLCGQTRLADVNYSFQKSADLCGVVIEVPSSKRSLQISDAVPLFAPFSEKMVALTANGNEKLYSQIAKELKPFAIQLTAKEPASDVAFISKKLNIKVFKSLHLPLDGTVSEADKLAGFIAAMDEYVNAGVYGFVLDSSTPNMYGGSGKKSDWGLAKKIIDAMPDCRILLAGGINQINSTEAASLKPWGIDLASGVEDTAGCKSKEKIDKLMETLGR